MPGVSEHKNISKPAKTLAMNQLSYVPSDWTDGDPGDPIPAPGDFWIGDGPGEFERLAA